MIVLGAGGTNSHPGVSTQKQSSHGSEFTRVSEHLPNNSPMAYDRQYLIHKNRSKITRMTVSPRDRRTLRIIVNANVRRYPLCSFICNIFVLRDPPPPGRQVRIVWARKCGRNGSMGGPGRGDKCGHCGVPNVGIREEKRNYDSNGREPQAATIRRGVAYCNYLLIYFMLGS